jgi:hypothetical protein
MQSDLQHADPHADPHDAIAAQLRDLAPRLAHDPSEFDAAPAATPEPASEPPLSDTPEPSLHATPLNSNTGDIRLLKPRAGAGRGVALIACAGIVAAAAWHAYGEEAQQRFAHLVPQFLAGGPAPAQNANAAEPQNAASEIAAPQPAADPAPAAQAQPAAAPSAPAVETPPPAQAALPPELAQSIETMAHEIASLKQTVEQLQTGQQQLSRDVAKVTEHEARRKPAAQAVKPAPRPQRTSARGAPPHNLGTLAPRSPPAYSQGQTTAQGTAQRDAYIPPPAPTQLPPQPGDTSVPRPPMPLR